MKLVFGLGNPGLEYKKTRHNIGYMVVDRIAREKNIIFKKSKFNADICEYYNNDNKILLIKPLSYMNLSGGVVRKIMDYYDIDSDDIIVIHDDLDMDFGRVKVVYNSSSGGHNGIKDIENNIGTKEYLRLKIGISNDKDIDTRDYVLGKFKKEELDELDKILDELIYFVDDCCCMNIDEIKSKYNRR